uniref:Uncharacterized protein n=1 Tax=Timema monikensis TaxID=170555 RepID=A0A7R9EKP8_9NEOP|nr:unnamed protein product [Timema monikensis]
MIRRVESQVEKFNFLVPLILSLVVNDSEGNNSVPIEPFNLIWGRVWLINSEKSMKDAQRLTKNLELDPSTFTTATSLYEKISLQLEIINKFGDVLDPIEFLTLDSIQLDAQSVFLLRRHLLGPSCRTTFTGLTRFLENSRLVLGESCRTTFDGPTRFLENLRIVSFLEIVDRASGRTAFDRLTRFPHSGIMASEPVHGRITALAVTFVGPRDVVF